MGIRIRIAATLGVVVLLAASASSVVGHDRPGQDPDAIAGLINRLAPAEPNAVQVSSSQLGDGSFSATSTDRGVSLPRDTNGMVVLSRGSGKARAELRLRLPDLGTAQSGRRATDGTVTYDDGSGRALNAVQAFSNGVRFATVILTPAAPSEYRYLLDIPAGAQLRLIDSGGIVVTGADGSFIAGAAAPWAKDSNGATVATRYEIRGNEVVQVIDHGKRGVQYPVVADPYFFINLIDHAAWQYHSGDGWTLMVWPTTWNRVNSGPTATGLMVANFGWDELYSYWRYHGLNVNVPGMKDQYVCHVQFAFWKDTYNLDEWRPNVGYPQTVAQLCNPGGARWFD